MSEFNELVRAFLLGNNIHFDESEKEPNTFILSEMEKKKGFVPELFQQFRVQKELLKIFILDEPVKSSKKIEINEEADMIIWNDSFSGKKLEEKIRMHLQEKTKQEIKKPIREVDPRFLGLGKDILYSKFYEKRMEDLLEMSKENVTNATAEEFFLNDEFLNEKRFAFILEESSENQFLKKEFNRFMDLFCNEKGVTSQSLPVYFESIDFWFGGYLHSQLTTRLNQDLGLFFTEDTIFYMVRLGYIIPFINEMDLYCREGYLNPQAPHISHLFHLCGERGMYVAGCSWESLFYDNIRDVLDLEKFQLDKEKQWLKTIARPMGSRILDDEVSAVLFGVEAGNPVQHDSERIIQENELKLKSWIEDRDFPILKPIDKIVLIKKLAFQWMERGAYYLELEDFNNILFESNILPEGKRTLNHIHEIVRAVMNSNVLLLSDFTQVIPVSRLMGHAITLWMLEEEFYDKKSLKEWLDRQRFSQPFFRILLKRFSFNKNQNIMTPLSISSLDILNNEFETSSNLNRKVIENALELYIAFNNSSYEKIAQPITGKKLHDMNMPHKIINGLKFKGADMHNALFQQSVFIECEFLECNLVSSYFAGSTFLKCRFEFSNLRNADFSGSSFQNCILKENKYEDAILIGCAFDKDCKMDLDISGKNKGLKIWSDGSSGIQGQLKKQNLDLPILIYLLQKKHRLYSRYGFKIDADLRFIYFEKIQSTLKNEKLTEQYSYYDVFDEIKLKPELFFARPGSIHYVSNKLKKEYRFFEGKNVQIDHVIKYKITTQTGREVMNVKILFHTDTETYIEETPAPQYWFRNAKRLSNKFVGRGVSGIFINSEKLIVATDIGGLFLFQKREDEWYNSSSKFQSEPVSFIYPDCFENMIFLKRGSSVIEIWDTLNDLSLTGRLVTSFREIIGIRLIENLNHAVIYGEWADESVGALAYNIINKHLVTYWDILSAPQLTSLIEKNLEKEYSRETNKLLKILKEKAIRKVSLEHGFIKKDCKELRQIMDSLEIIPPQSMTYMEGEPVEFEWKIRSNNPDKFPVNKTYMDVTNGEKMNFECEIKIGNILNVQSGKFKIEQGIQEVSILWKENALEIKDPPYGNHELFFAISLLGKRREIENTFKLRPKNPFKGGDPISKKIGSDYLFVGRETELKIARDLILKGASFSIKGARRIGKTSFINRLQESLPENIMAAYISFEEFEMNSSHSALLAKIKNGLNNLMKTHPEIYNTFKEDLDVMKNIKPSLDFEWVMSMGLQRLKENYPELIMPKISELEKERGKGKSLASLFDKLSEYLKKIDKTTRIVFIIDEIGLVEKKGIKLNEIFTPFRPIIGRGNIIMILAGIPLNFHELTLGADLVKESGFMSYLNKHVSLGPLSEKECKNLILDNLSNQFKIDDKVLDYALQLSAMRPEDLQIIMHEALELASSSSSGNNTSFYCIEFDHIEAGFTQLLKNRGCTCFQIWEQISEKGKLYLKNKLNSSGKNLRELLDVVLDDIDFINLHKEDIDIFKGYGFTSPDEKTLIIPVYFQEWIRQEHYLQQIKMED